MALCQDIVTAAGDLFERTGGQPGVGGTTRRTGDGIGDPVTEPSPATVARCASSWRRRPDHGLCLPRTPRGDRGRVAECAMPPVDWCSSRRAPKFPVAVRSPGRHLCVRRVGREPGDGLADLPAAPRAGGDADGPAGRRREIDLAQVEARFNLALAGISQLDEVGTAGSPGPEGPGEAHRPRARDTAEGEGHPDRGHHPAAPLNVPGTVGRSATRSSPPPVSGRVVRSTGDRLGSQPSRGPCVSGATRRSRSASRATQLRRTGRSSGVVEHAEVDLLVQQLGVPPRLVGPLCERPDRLQTVVEGLGPVLQQRSGQFVQYGFQTGGTVMRAARRLRPTLTSGPRAPTPSTWSTSLGAPQRSTPQRRTAV